MGLAFFNAARKVGRQHVLDPYTEDLRPVRDEGFGAYAARVSQPYAQAVAKHFDPEQADADRAGARPSRRSGLAMEEVQHPASAPSWRERSATKGRAWLAIAPGAARRDRRGAGARAGRRAARRAPRPTSARRPRRTAPRQSSSSGRRGRACATRSPRCGPGTAAARRRCCALTSRVHALLARADRCRGRTRTRVSRPTSRGCCEAIHVRRHRRAAAAAETGAAAAHVGGRRGARLEGEARLGHCDAWPSSSAPRRTAVLLHGDFDERNLLVCAAAGSARSTRFPASATRPTTRRTGCTRTAAPAAARGWRRSWRPPDCRASACATGPASSACTAELREDTGRPRGRVESTPGMSRSRAGRLPSHSMPQPMPCE